MLALCKREHSAFSPSKSSDRRFCRPEPQACRQQTKFAALRYVQEGFFAMEQDLRLDRPKLVSDTHHIQIHRLCQVIHIGIFRHWLFLCGFTFHLFFF